MPRAYYFWRRSRIEGAGCKIVDNGDSKGVHCREPAGLHAAGGARCLDRGTAVRAKAHGAQRPSVLSARGGCTEVLTVLAP